MGLVVPPVVVEVITVAVSCASASGARDNSKMVMVENDRKSALDLIDCIFKIILLFCFY